MINIDELKIVNFHIGEESKLHSIDEDSNNNKPNDDKKEEDLAESKAEASDETNLQEDLEKEKKTEENYSPISCYLCIKVNNNKEFVSCPLDRKMKNKLKSEFWFQFNDEWLVMI
jgi:hypothetical protein